MIVRFRVAGLTLALRSSGSTSAGALPPASRPFACARGADIALTLVDDEIPRPPREHLLFESGAVWRVHRFDGGYLYTFQTPVLDPPVYKAVAIDADLTRGVLHFPPPRRGRRPRLALDFPLDELLFQHRIARNGGMEVHACSLVLDGGAVLFCGRSGAGKSTTARLWRRFRPRTPILSDDRIVLSPRRGRMWAFGTPWHGAGGFASPEGRPLRALLFLRHARRNGVTHLGAADAAARLFARTFPPPWDSAAVGRVLEACGRVAEGVPCYELAFRPDASAVATTLEALAATPASRA